MREVPLEPFLDLFWVVAYSLVTTLLTVGGVLIERSGVAVLATDTTTGVWMAFIGAVALGAAYLVATDRLLPSVRALRA
ncbi:hypothetical protein [Halomarina oriensis]|uniref:DUF8151 domain-containing protein n=1 Tax=Halomarina oriensis TaxID=671145 RepID=A0A6B0GIB6_9EURY|nr:hypothetical protein [Halomarina oriensis]MWG34612.1 hypothetical protein [Halomarina oriensis]